MNTAIWLVRREFWENRAIWLIPAVFGGLLILASLFGGYQVLGAVDPERMAKLQDFYLAKGIIQKKSPVEDLFTNQFVM